jgi:hypothetical protein
MITYMFTRLHLALVLWLLPSSFSSCSFFFLLLIFCNRIFYWWRVWASMPSFFLKGLLLSITGTNKKYRHTLSFVLRGTILNKITKKKRNLCILSNNNWSLHQSKKKEDIPLVMLISLIIWELCDPVTTLYDWILIPRKLETKIFKTV